MISLALPTQGGPGINNSDVILASEECGGYVEDVTDYGYNWQSSNTAVATLPNPTLHTVAPGSATGKATVQLGGWPGLNQLEGAPLKLRLGGDFDVPGGWPSFAFRWHHHK